jgi:hypothetical protein
METINVCCTGFPKHDPNCRYNTGLIAELKAANADADRLAEAGRKAAAELGRLYAAAILPAGAELHVRARRAELNDALAQYHARVKR